MRVVLPWMSRDQTTREKLRVGDDAKLCEQDAMKRSSLVKTLPFRVRAPVKDTQKGFNVAAPDASPQEGE